MFSSRLFTSLLILLFVLSAIANCGAGERRGAIVVVANRVTLGDIHDSSRPALAGMLKESYAALISPDCAGPKLERSILLTASAGASTMGGSFVKEFYAGGETVFNGAQRASSAFEVFTGRRAPFGGALFLGLGEAVKANENIRRSTRLGIVGDALNAIRDKTGIVGNADGLGGDIDRSAAVLAMDSQGIVDIERFSAGSPIDPCGILSDPDKLTQAALESAENVRLVVVYFGDTSRLDDSRNLLSEQAYRNYKGRALDNLERLIAQVLKRADSRAVALVSFYPPSDAPEGTLTPLLLHGSYSGSGLLVSPTTRTPGLIAASDFAPTILRAMYVSPDNISLGRAAAPTNDNESVIPALTELETRVISHEAVWVPLLWIVVVIGVVAFLGAVAVTAFPIALPAWCIAVIKYAILAIGSAPAAMLLAALWPAGVRTYVAGTVVAMAALAVAGVTIGKLFRCSLLNAAPLLAVYLLTTLIIVVDIISGGNMVRYAAPCSYQYSGLRYYGVGNEYASLLIGMTGVLCAFAADSFGSRAATRWVAGLGVVAFVVLGMGHLGANYGATLAALVTFIMLYFSIRRGVFGARHIVLAVTAAVILTGLIAFADAKLRGSSEAHGGRLAEMVQSVGPAYPVQLIVRKAAMNLKIAGSERATAAITILAPIALLWMWKVRARVSMLFNKDGATNTALKAILVGAVAALVFNDSGIVMLGLILSCIAAAVLYSLVERITGERN